MDESKPVYICTFCKVNEGYNITHDLPPICMICYKELEMDRTKKQSQADQDFWIGHANFLSEHIKARDEYIKVLKKDNTRLTAQLNKLRLKKAKPFNKLSKKQQVAVLKQASATEREKILGDIKPKEDKEVTTQ